MTFPGSAASVASADAITADRHEAKYLVAAGAAQRLVRALSERLPVHRFTGEGANRLPDAHHFITTIYFDTPEHDHLRAACRDAEHNVKIRAREYYDLHPSLAELATNPAQIVRYQPWVWFEVKRRDDGRSHKRRLRLPKRELPAFLRAEHPAFEAEGAAAADPDRLAIVDFCRAQASAFVPSCIVNYRRIAFQDPTASLRVTVDLDIGFYRPPADLWTRSFALVRGTFGVPASVERGALMEVKRSGAAPAWLEGVLAEAGAEAVSYSKFARGGQAVHGRP